MGGLTAKSSSFELLERIDPDILGAVAILSVIMFFVLLVTSVVTICRTYQNVTLARMQSQMLNDLLAKGYSVDEIQQLIYGHKRSVFTRFFDGSRQTYVSQRPAPPVK